MSEENFNRPPRIQPLLPVGDIEIPNPPSPGRMGRFLSILTSLIPLVTILGYALVIGGRNPVMMLPMGLAAIVTSGVSYMTWRHNQRQEEAAQERYARILDDLRKQMFEAHEQQRAFYNYTFPPIPRVLELAAKTDIRLWERRPEEADFGQVRLGVGNRVSQVTLKSPRIDNTDSPLALRAMKLAEESRTLDSAALTISLRETFALGIAGHNYQLSTDFTRALLAQLASLHAPSDARLFIIGSQETRSQWQWARWLPHCSISTEEPDSSGQLCFDPDQYRSFWNQLQAELQRRQSRLADQNTADESVRLPMLFVVVDLFHNQGGKTSPLDADDADVTVSMLLNRGQELGGAILFVTPDFGVIPSECSAIIEVESEDKQPVFRYAQVGLNSPRLDGRAELLNASQAEAMARVLAPLSVRMSYRAEIPQSLSFLDMMEADNVEKLQMLKRWQHSKEVASWPQVTLGKMMGDKTRTLVFSAKQDGIHSLIAGTTGSGKSELLMTLIVGLMVNYDPSIINFVLVDYKGGTAFESFRNLPHTVDVITNLQGQAGTRAFTAIRAELNRRQAIIGEANVEDIVAYRKKGLHHDKPLPHLFVVIDEFAEMVKERTEFKGPLESIARLGRQLGVHLILATQQPSGVVSGQIRSNIKLRICMRVEAPADSREVLGRTDAAYLPPNIPGRAYIQVGNENIELIQVARSSEAYYGLDVASTPDIVFLDADDSTSTPMPEKAESGVETLSEVLVNIAIRLARENKDIKPQLKPWHDPLPERITFNTVRHILGRHIAAVGSEAAVDWNNLPLTRVQDVFYDIDRTVEGWKDGSKQSAWPGIDWRNRVMQAIAGVIDDPERAQQLPLLIDFKLGHVALYGAPGSGKTSFIRTLLTQFVCTHSPEELEIYVLDFGGGGLQIMDQLPHVGAVITSLEQERSQRLLRTLANMLEVRQSLFAQSKINSLSEYNQRHPKEPLPAVLLVLDNFAEFKEIFFDDIPALTALARNGLAYGMHLLITAEQVSTIPAQLGNQFTRRLALKMADSGDYSAVVGQGVSEIGEIPGRGFVRWQRRPLEFQTLLPIHQQRADSSISDDSEAHYDSLVVEATQTIIDNMAGYTGPQVLSIGILPRRIALQDLVESFEPAKQRVPLLGQLDLDLSALSVDLRSQGPHFAIVGPPLSGKTTALRTWLLSLAYLYSPEDVGLVLIDPRGSLYDYGGQHSLRDLPHVQAAIGPDRPLTGAMGDLIDGLESAFGRWIEGRNQKAPAIVVFIDNYDDFSGEVGSVPMFGSGGSNRQVAKEFATLMRKYGRHEFHVVTASSINIGTSDTIIKEVFSCRYGLGLDAEEAPNRLGARLRNRSSQELPQGRGYIVKSGRTSLLQIATPQQYESNPIEDELDGWVERILARYTDPVTWIEMIDSSLEGEAK